MTDPVYLVDGARHDECFVFWGSHGCDLPAGHEGVHVCGSGPDPCSEFIIDRGSQRPFDEDSLPGHARYRLLTQDGDDEEWSEWLDSRAFLYFPYNADHDRIRAEFLDRLATALDLPRELLDSDVAHDESVLDAPKVDLCGCDRFDLSYTNDYDIRVCSCGHPPNEHLDKSGTCIGDVIMILGRDDR